RTSSYAARDDAVARDASYSTMSAPDAKARSPRPDTTTTLTSGSSANASSVRVVARCIASVSAFRSAGFAKTIRPTPASTSATTCALPLSTSRITRPPASVGERRDPGHHDQEAKDEEHDRATDRCLGELLARTGVR